MFELEIVFSIFALGGKVIDLGIKTNLDFFEVTLSSVSFGSLIELLVTSWGLRLTRYQLLLSYIRFDINKFLYLDGLNCLPSFLLEFVIDIRLSMILTNQLYFFIVLNAIWWHNFINYCIVLYFCLCKLINVSRYRILEEFIKTRSSFHFNFLCNNYFILI